jgi:hypothetical protein
MKAVALLVAATLVLAGCFRAGSDIGASPTVIVPGTPAAVYERVLPDVKKRTSDGTKVIRMDDSGTITMRFSVAAGDRSVRLIEVVLREADARQTSVFIRSKRFSFVPGSSRDETDLALENELLECFKKTR